MSILNVSGVQKIYTTRFGGNKVEALKSVTFDVEQGEYVAIMGESGSGKTTLLNILAALDKPTSGSVVLDGKNLSKIKESQVAAFRRDNLGFVFQEFNLLDTFSLEDNIYLPLVLAGKGHKEMQERLKPIAAQLGMQRIPKAINKKRLVRYKEGAEMYSMGMNKFQSLAKDAGAILKIDRMVLVDLDVFDQYLESFRVK